MKITKLFTLTLAAALLFCTTGCEKNKSKTNTTSINEQPVTPGKTAVKLKHINSETAAYLSGKTIAVILGHSYNDEETVSNLTQLLNLNYGVETEDSPALIKVLVYPQDFMFAGKIRVSSLYTNLEDKNLAGIITVGAPEGLCNALAKLEDKDISKTEEALQQAAEAKETASTEDAEQKPILRSYPVFSLFPQDDILGSESTADFVLDFVQKASIEQEAADFVPYDVSSMLISSVQSMINLRGPVPEDKDLIKFVQKLTGKQKTIHKYFDSETGLVSVNHFIFE